MHRKIAMMEWNNWLLRLCLSGATQYLLSDQKMHIDIDRAVYECGLLYPYIFNPVTDQNRKNKIKQFAYIQTCLRYVVACSGIIIFNVYIFTIDEHGEETSLDLLKDFTALVILIKIGNFLRNAVDIEVEELTKLYEL